MLGAIPLEDKDLVIIPKTMTPDMNPNSPHRATSVAKQAPEINPAPAKTWPGLIPPGLVPLILLPRCAAFFHSAERAWRSKASILIRIQGFFRPAPGTCTSQLNLR